MNVFIHGIAVCCVINEFACLRDEFVIIRIRVSVYLQGIAVCCVINEFACLRDEFVIIRIRVAAYICRDFALAGDII